MKSRMSRVLSVVWVLVLAVGLLQSPISVVQAVSPDVVISQVYGGGGNAGAPYTNDFVELFNRGTTTVSLAGLSVQYASATGTGTFSQNFISQLSGTLAPGQYYLVRSAGGSVGIPLPTPDATGGVNMSATGGKVVLVASPTGLACNGGSVPCSTAQMALIKDLVGYGTANFYEGNPAPTLSNNTAGLRNGNGCIDTDNNSSDFTAGAPTPRNTASPLNPCAAPDTAPTVVSTHPVNGATDFPIEAYLKMNFSEPVDVSGNWFELNCSVSGIVSAAVSGGPSNFIIDPAVGLAVGETCTLTVFASQVSDQDTDDPPDAMVENFTMGFSPSDVCGVTYTPIYAIQGSGLSAAITGATTTQGLVVGDYEGPSPTLRGFYMQDMSGDGDEATSDGIFVFNGNNDHVNLGDVVLVTGNATEFQDQTQISATSVIQCSTGSLVPVDVNMPFDSANYLEQYEGMLVHFPQKLYVTEHFQLGRFGQVVVSSNGRLPIPTHLAEPGADAQAVQDANNLNRIIIDDALNNQNPDPILFGRDGLPLSASNTLRGGDSVTGVVGVLTYTWAGNSASGNAYRLRPINALGGGVPNFTAENQRPDPLPAPGGELKVAGMNLLNYFNTFTGCANGVGGESTDCRGAENITEFNRQAAKTVAAIQAIDADVIGLVEIENDGYGSASAIADLVNRLNIAAGADTYAYIDADTATGQVNTLGIDAIKVGFIYKPAAVTPLGTAVLNTGAFGQFDITTPDGPDTTQRSRPALAQTFEQVSDGARFTAVVNHLKSKGSTCADNVSPIGPDPDTGDLQGNCNLTRLAAAEELATWLATDPTGSDDPDVLILGDLNSYALEDPIQALLNAGFTDLISTFSGLDGYSYVFDGQWGYLDYALASAGMTAQVSGVVEYHINSDEPSVLDYNTNFKSAGQIASLYAPDEFRVSDHDPVVVGLDPNVAPVVGPISALVNPVALGAQVELSASFTDADLSDTHTALWDWGDGTTSAGTVSETGGAGTVQDSHTYAATGVYRVTLTVTDQVGDSGESVLEYVVVYDPQGGFVTGGGWIDSPAGAYSLDPDLSGKAEFDFDAKYLKNATVPSGSTVFLFSMADLLFESSAFDWLVISGVKAQLKGTGTINGTGAYSFWLSVVDGLPDMFRIRIWDTADGTVIYDNQSGAADTADPTTALGAGKIVIHKGK